MKQRNFAFEIAFLLLAVLANASSAFGAQPQVPSLPSQTAGYVKYAVEDLPAQYTAPAVANTNNARVDNPLTDAGATLGRVLFYDTRLSHTNGVACASCHQQSKGFSDPNQFSQGVNGQTGRHSPGLSNAAYYANGKAFWDERADSLEDQALVPIQNEVEMGSTLNEVVGKLSQTKFYPQLFQAAFGTPDVTPERIGKAIAQFERSMVSYKSKYDSAFTPGAPGPNFPAVFNAAELAGQNLFNNGGRCSSCHGTDAHVSNGVHNIGLDATNTDIGAGNGTFKSPSLRNIEVRGRFMHDGRFSTLEEVVQFYNTGIQNNPNLDPLLKNGQGTPLRLNLSTTQVNQLVAYLQTLTDNTFLTSDLFSNPFVTLPGDYTGDGEVDVADYDLWRSNYGDTTSLVADGNGDLIVDAGDYVVWRRNLGRTWLDLAIGSAIGSGAAFTTEAVPEPAGIALATMALVWGLGYRARRVVAGVGGTGRSPQRR
jgi:cytochrome c peroxidase